MPGASATRRSQIPDRARTPRIGSRVRQRRPLRPPQGGAPVINTTSPQLGPSPGAAGGPNLHPAAWSCTRRGRRGGRQVSRSVRALHAPGGWPRGLGTSPGSRSEWAGGPPRAAARAPGGSRLPLAKGGSHGRLPAPRPGCRRCSRCAPVPRGRDELGEAHLPAKQAKAREDARLPGPHVDSRRPRGAQGPPAEGPAPPGRLTVGPRRTASISSGARSRRWGPRGAVVGRPVRLNYLADPAGGELRRVAYAIPAEPAGLWSETASADACEPRSTRWSTRWPPVPTSSPPTRLPRLTFDDLITSLRSLEAAGAMREDGGERRGARERRPHGALASSHLPGRPCGTAHVVPVPPELLHVREPGDRGARLPWVGARRAAPRAARRSGARHRPRAALGHGSAAMTGVLAISNAWRAIAKPSTRSSTRSRGCSRSSTASSRTTRSPSRSSTVLIMALLTPLTVKSTKSMLAMQKLQPELKRLQQKYKPRAPHGAQRGDDAPLPRGRREPRDGCITGLLQAPFLFILYSVIRGLSNTVVVAAGTVVNCSSSRRTSRRRR